MSIEPRGPIDPALAKWNDDMYAAHPTPYERGVARWIELARVRAVLELARIQPNDAVLEVGCESGRLLASCPPCRRLVGADISGRALARTSRAFAASLPTLRLRT